MKITDTIRRAGRNLRRAKMRTFLTCTAIAVGGFAIMASSMAGEGARQYVDRIISSNTDPKGLTIAKDKQFTSAQVLVGGSRGEMQEYNPNAANYYGINYETISQADLDNLRARDDLEDVEPYYQLQPKYVEFGAVGGKKYTAGVSMRDRSIRIETLSGKAMDKGVQLAENEAMISEDALKALGKSADEVLGSKLTITVVQQPQQMSEEEVAQIYAAKGEAGLRELTEGKTRSEELTIVAIGKNSADQSSSLTNVYINPGLAKDLVDFSTIGTDNYQKYMMAWANAKGSDPEAVKKALEEDGYYAMTSKDLQQMLFTFVNVLQSIVLGFGVLALIVSVFGIVNTMYISVLERTQQIGLMKALGASRRDVGRLFRFEAAWVGFLGGVFGVLLAWVAGSALNPIISESIGLGEHSLLIFEPMSAMTVVICLMLVAIVAGFLPSRKAAKLDPIEALRTE